MRFLSQALRHLIERTEPPVFFGSAGLVIVFCVIGGVFTEWASDVFSGLQQSIVEYFGWYYLLIASGFLIFIVWVMVRHGGVRLGKDNSRPEFGRLSWFTMLFAAGMGIGLVFWSVAEPLTHFTTPPMDMAAANSPEAVREALRYTFFHWGLHPWAIYIVLAMALAYFHFRHDLPLAPRSILYPLIGERFRGWPGHGVDILCTVGTLLGVATSLGLGAMQINAGLTKLAGIADSTGVQILIIALITLAAGTSVVIGLKGGVRRLSKFNLYLAAALWLFVLIAGPTIYLLETFVGGVAVYLQKLVVTSLWVDFTRDTDWQSSWTFFYWGWWISWSPFVGVFVARVSKGRTIREFVLGVLIVPTVASLLWLSVFGGTGLWVELFGGGGLAAEVTGNAAISLHAMLEHLPLTSLTQGLATLVIVIFFITSSDSGSLVDDMVTTGGHPHPPKATRVFWAGAEGTAAATLLLLGGLSAMQNAAISLGLPMSVLLIAACVALWRALCTEERTKGRPRTSRLAPESERGGS